MGATFLLVINFAIGLSFAIAFLALAWRSPVTLSRWCAAGFLAASATVTAEALSPVIPSVRLTSTLSFSMLMLALTLLAAGLVRHYRARARIGWLFAIAIAASLFNTFVLVDEPRGQPLNAFGYQGPFALMTAIGAGAILLLSPRRPIDLVLATVLALSALQFVAKAAIAVATRTGPGVKAYLSSDYAFYSQTAGGILSLLLGIALIGLVAVEVMAAASQRMRRDELSGMLTRGAFLEAVGERLARAPRGMPMALIMCDLDHFKQINDGFGHAAGDAVIRAVGANLIALAGDDGLCGRIGGEEFCVLLPDCGAVAAQIYVDAMRGLNAMTAIPLLPKEQRVTASFGVAITDRDEAVEAAMRRADLALYAAKSAGRDGWRLAPLAPDTALGEPGLGLAG
ncbi:GGDEF domain-containing protein [Kaistia geumhonensis]|uniref:diguanylate cyclase n=1 Tax=Kaistia geumhonensis TaxID=410839 RepID=A0ABU0M7P4_9HYPH|nr:GGDEF domain-containing protein [Kaistia geumhonensis]MCX5477841.1 GGDEF domain-containing protein [Kaistia geumhonensis]MDQ0516947.1 diguanylate cyclase (GGDEF)-like protein [Kaistia geumhonensis]